MALSRYLIGLFRRVRSFILRREVQVVGECRLCGICCGHLLLRDNGRWLRTEKEFRRLVEFDPVHACFEPLGHNLEGDMLFACRNLGEDNFCTEYESRPSLCRNYPAKSLYYRGGNLREECGYSFKAVTFLDVLMRRKGVRKPVFSRVLEQELEQDNNSQ